MDADVIVVGAGLAGLAAASELQSTGRSVMVLEASDGPGGRVRTDQVDGFLLDRGFQILLTAYPEAQRFFDYAQLDLRAFLPGAAVRDSAGMHRLSDPFRRPKDLISTVRSPVGSLPDKLRTLQFRRAVCAGSLGELWARPETSAAERLRSAGFSSNMIDSFFGPLFAGITLDDELTGSSRMIEFVFRMLSQGDAAVPAKGMGELSNQLAARLGDSIRYDAKVERVAGTQVQLSGGESRSAGAVIVATDMTAAAALVDLNIAKWNSVTSLWFRTPVAPVADPVIVLNGAPRGAVNNLAVMSNVSSHYAPAGQHLVVVSSPRVEPGLVSAIETELGNWFDPFGQWERLAVQEIPHAQPELAPGTPHRPATVGDGVFLAGDHRTDASINGALASGSRAALAAAEYLGSAPKGRL